MSTLDTFDDMMNELERGEIESNKLFFDGYFSLKRKMKRNISNNSILSSDKSCESLSPEPDECFSWELNCDELLNNSYTTSSLDASYKNFSLENYENSSDSLNHIHIENQVQSNLFDNSTNEEVSKRSKNKPLYHSMRHLSNRSSHQNSLKNNYQQNSTKMQTYSSQELFPNTKFETRINIS